MPPGKGDSEKTVTLNGGCFGTTEARILLRVFFPGDERLDPRPKMEVHLTDCTDAGGMVEAGDFV